MKPLMTAHQVADILNIHYRTVLNLRRTGELPATPIAGTYRWSVTDIENYIQKQKKESAA